MQVLDSYHVILFDFVGIGFECFDKDIYFPFRFYTKPLVGKMYEPTSKMPWESLMICALYLAEDETTIFGLNKDSCIIFQDILYWDTIKYFQIVFYQRLPVSNHKVYNIDNPIS